MEAIFKLMGNREDTRFRMKPPSIKSRRERVHKQMQASGVELNAKEGRLIHPNLGSQLYSSDFRRVAKAGASGAGTTQGRSQSEVHRATQGNDYSGGGWWKMQEVKEDSDKTSQEEEVVYCQHDRVPGRSPAVNPDPKARPQLQPSEQAK